MTKNQIAKIRSLGPGQTWTGKLPCGARIKVERSNGPYPGWMVGIEDRLDWAALLESDEERIPLKAAKLNEFGLHLDGLVMFVMDRSIGRIGEILKAMEGWTGKEEGKGR